MVTLKLDLENGVQFDGDRELPDSHYRLCYRRQFGDWRLRDERTAELYHVENFAGDGDATQVTWMDGGSHIFHDGPIYLDENNVAHLKPREEL